MLLRVDRLSAAAAPICLSSVLVLPENGHKFVNFWSQHLRPVGGPCSVKYERHNTNADPHPSFYH